MGKSRGEVLGCGESGTMDAHGVGVAVDAVRRAKKSSVCT